MYTAVAHDSQEGLTNIFERCKPSTGAFDRFTKRVCDDGRFYIPIQGQSCLYL